MERTFYSFSSGSKTEYWSDRDQKTTALLELHSIISMYICSIVMLCLVCNDFECAHLTHKPNQISNNSTITECVSIAQITKKEKKNNLKSFYSSSYESSPCQIMWLHNGAEHVLIF